MLNKSQLEEMIKCNEGLPCKNCSFLCDDGCTASDEIVAKTALNLLDLLYKYHLAYGNFNDEIAEKLLTMDQAKDLYKTFVDTEALLVEMGVIRECEDQ